MRAQPPEACDPTTGRPLVLNPAGVVVRPTMILATITHVSEPGSPHARYAILAIDDAQVSVEMIGIGYDWKAAAARPARQHYGWGSLVALSSASSVAVILAAFAIAHANSCPRSLSEPTHLPII